MRRVVRLLGYGGIAAFVGGVVALHGLRANLDPTSHTISEYSLGDYGWLMRVAFGSLGLGVAATAIGLRWSFGSSLWRWLGYLSLAATAVGLFLDAGYNTDRPGVSETFDGSVHGDGMLIVCLSLPAATYILGRELSRFTPRLQQTKMLQALGPAQLVGVLGFEISPPAWRGATERIAVTMGVVGVALLQSLVTPYRRKTKGWEAAHSPPILSPQTFQVVTPVDSGLTAMAFDATNPTRTETNPLETGGGPPHPAACESQPMRR